MTPHPHNHHVPHSGGISDQAMLQHTVDAYPGRFGLAFWDMFDREVVPRLPGHAAVVDLACGSGLLLQDMGRRLPKATLYGYDVSPVMLKHARGLDYGEHRPTLRKLDLGKRRVPLSAESIHLATMTLALHHFEDPIGVLQGIRRLLTPGGMLLLCEWERTPFQEYLQRWDLNLGTMRAEERARTFERYAMICRFSQEDWRYLLASSGLTVEATNDLGRPFLAFLARTEREKAAQGSDSPER